MDNQRIDKSFIRSIARGLRVCQSHDELGFRFGGMWIDIEKERAEVIMNKGVDLVIKALGKSKAAKEFKRYNVIL